MSIRIKNISFVLFIITFFASVSFSQDVYVVSGKIKSKGNEALFGANIYIKSVFIGTTADETGRYSLNAGMGRDTIVVSFVGYQEIRLPINLRKDTIINFVLEEVLHFTSEVIVTAEREDENIKSTDIGTVDLDIDDIKNLPVLMGEVDPLKTLQLLPGVQNSVEGSSGMYVRGGNVDQNLLLLDEAVIYNPSHLMGFFSVFNPDALTKIKLVKGGMPANYGGRLASILDVSVKEGDMKKMKCNGGVGFIASRITLQGPLVKDKLSFIVSARRTYIDKLLKPFVKESDASSSVFFNPTGYYFHDVNLKMTYILNDKNKLSLNSYVGKDVYSLAQEKVSFNNSMNWGNSASSLQWKSVINNKMSAKTSLIYSKYKFEFAAFQNDNEFNLFSGIRDITAKTDFVFIPHLKHNIQFGAIYTFHTFTPNNSNAKTGELNLDFDNQNNYYARDAALYISDKFDLNKRIRISAGLRFTHFQQTGPYTSFDYNDTGEITDSVNYKANEAVKTYAHVEPRFSIRYGFNNNSSIKMSYTQNYQYIHLATVSSISMPTDIWMPSTQTILPQFGTQYSIGYFRNFRDNVFETSCELFYKELQNQIEFKNDLVNNYFASANVIEANLTTGKGTAYGAEFLLRKQKGDYSGWISYTMAKTTRLFPEINQGMEYPAKYDRRHDLSIVMSRDLKKKWIFSIIFKYTSGNALTLPVSRYMVQRMIVNEYGEKNSFRMPDYHRMDASVTYNPKKGKRVQSSWTFAVYNLYNRQNPFYIYFDASGDVTKYKLSVKAKQVTLFPILPSITWNFKF